MNIAEAKRQVEAAVRAYFACDGAGEPRIPADRQRPLFLVGAPGVGKSAIVGQAAADLGVAFVSYAMTHHTRQSAIGLPFISEMEFGGQKKAVTEYTMSEIVASIYEKMKKTGLKEGILFIGPDIKHLDMFGDKVNARKTADAAGIPTVPGTGEPVRSVDEVKQFAKEHGFPIIIKASSGGGGRGMRIVRSLDSLKEAYQRAKSEALTSFGNDEIYVEKLLENIKHIEVQILGDTEGNLVHLYERDCSVQRRHQKVVEIAPSVTLSKELRLRICDAAVQLMKHVGYISAGTVEFLVTPDDRFYFIEVNPRIQVEHTITEMITGVDIVQSQLLIADGCSLHSPEIGLPQQSDIPCNGHALQCRVTTEDPSHSFMPDTGKITV